MYDLLRSREDAVEDGGGSPGLRAARGSPGWEQEEGPRSDCGSGKDREKADEDGGHTARGESQKRAMRLDEGMKNGTTKVDVGIRGLDSQKVLKIKGLDLGL